MDDEPTYCPVCGSRLVTAHVEGRDRRYCQSCDRVHYRNPKPCAGTLVVDGERLLLVERTEPPDVGSWSVPAGYLECDEPPRAAAVRELREETGLRVAESSITLFDTVFVAHPNGRRVLVLVYVAPAARAEGEPEAGDDAGDARFWTLAELAERGERVELGYETVFEAAVRAVTESETGTSSA